MAKEVKINSKSIADNDFYVNLPLSYIAFNRSYLDFFLSYGLCPELGLDAFVIDNKELSWHREIVGQLEANGLQCSIHLPFCDLQPGSMDAYILEATRQRLDSALEVAALYQPRLLVGHAYFSPLYKHHSRDWLELAAETWSTALSKWAEHPPLMLENTRETEPWILAALADSLSQDNVGICLDTGHWYSFGEGKKRENLQDWIAALAPYIGHLHFSDNGGDNDDHLAMGQGEIPWKEFFKYLQKYNLHPTFTLEPHNKSALQQDLIFLRQNPHWAGECSVDCQKLEEIALRVIADSSFSLP